MALQETRFAFDFYGDFRAITIAGGVTVADVLEDLGIVPDIEAMSRELIARASGPYLVSDDSGTVDITVAGRVFTQRSLKRALGLAIATLAREDDPNAGRYGAIAMATLARTHRNPIAIVQDIQTEWPDPEPPDDAFDDLTY